MRTIHRIFPGNHWRARVLSSAEIGRWIEAFLEFNRAHGTQSEAGWPTNCVSEEILQVLVEMEDTISFQLFVIVCSTLARRDPARY